MRFRNENVNVPQRITSVKPLQFTVNTLSTISFNNSAPQLQYKINDGQWIDYNTASVSITLNVGDVIKWKRKVSTVRTAPLGRFSMTGSLSASGNIMSLLDGDNFATMIDLTGWGGSDDGIFESLFKNCTVMTNHSIAMPATTLSTRCYFGMFENTGITNTPELPATNLAPLCYMNMFMSSSQLTQGTSLPATILANKCYWSMFWGTNLMAAPELNATTLVAGCYANMFGYCSNINNIKCLATSGLDTENCTSNWLGGVSASGTFTKAAGVTWPSGIDGIPSGWTVVEE